MSKNKDPLGIGVKIGSKDEKAWTDILKQAETAVESGLREITINNTIAELARSEIAKAKAKFAKL